MAVPKWNDERTSELESFVGTEAPISQATVVQAAESLETSTRSVSSKLRKMGYDVELASTNTSKAFSDVQEDILESFVSDNSGQYTYADVASGFQDGKFSAKQIQGKILSMELTGHIKPTPKPETVKTYSDAEEAVFIKLVNKGAFVEAIAAELDRSVNSVRGKALSLLRAGTIVAIPRQETTKAGTRVDPLAELADVESMTVEAIATEIGKTVRGVKTMLTRRGISASDYDGAARREKAAAAVV
jgi:transposase|tara:strand:- start:648 stop:1382 length:735 start_codon:yes stop_codon:yes gene_type:complete